VHGRNCPKEKEKSAALSGRRRKESRYAARAQGEKGSGNVAKEATERGREISPVLSYKEEGECVIPIIKTFSRKRGFGHTFSQQQMREILPSYLRRVPSLQVRREKKEKFYPFHTEEERKFFYSY